jgi:putative membrane protein
MFDPVISSLPAFAGYFATVVGLLAVFVVLYVFVTPYDELALIREGNVAAAICLAGAIIGYALPIAVSVAASHNIYVMIGWGVVAGIVQLLAYVVARLALPQINLNIPQGKIASGIFLASLSLGIGILNAGCIA